MSALWASGVVALLDKGEVIGPVPMLWAGKPSLVDSCISQAQSEACSCGQIRILESKHRWDLSQIKGHRSQDQEGAAISIFQDAPGTPGTVATEQQGWTRVIPLLW